jgi:hypothetical protein
VAWATSLGGAACSAITGDSDQPVALEFVAPPDTVLVGETAFVAVRVLNRAGDSIPGADVSLLALNPDTLDVVPDTTLVVGVAPGPGRIVAASAGLRSEPFRIIVKSP